MSFNRRSFLLGLAGITAIPGAARAVDYPIPKIETSLVPWKYRRQVVKFKTSEPAGTIVVDSRKFWLYYVTGNGKAVRYGIGVGREGKSWSGEAHVARKAKWPKWTPTAEMQQIIPLYKRYAKGMPGGLDNPLGARALYLLNEGGVDNLIRIHGTPAASTIGRATTAGCFRMLNTDVVELYEKVNIGTRVVVLPR